MARSKKREMSIFDEDEALFEELLSGAAYHNEGVMKAYAKEEELLFRAEKRETDPARKKKKKSRKS